MPREVRAEAEPSSSLMPRSFADLVVMAGVLTYGAMYFVSAELFYGRFGVEPADVGLGYADLLGQAAVFLAAAVVAAIVVAVVAAAVLAAAEERSSWKRFVQVLRDELASVRTSRPRRVIVLAITLAFVLGYLVVESLWQSSAIRAGETPTGLSVLLPWSDTVAAHVVWADGSATRPDLPVHCLTRLGEGQGTEIFYDYRSHETLRLPQDEIEVTIRPGQDCRGAHDGEG